jgi:hypothetical protein
MDDIQEDYRDQLASIISLKGSNKAKALLLENLINTVREVQDLSYSPDLAKCRANCDALSTSISECYSVSYASEKDVE